MKRGHHKDVKQDRKNSVPGLCLHAWFPSVLRTHRDGGIPEPFEGSSFLSFLFLFFPILFVFSRENLHTFSLSLPDIEPSEG